jgi:hypothetical protein
MNACTAPAPVTGSDNTERLQPNSSASPPIRPPRLNLRRSIAECSVQHAHSIQLGSDGQFGIVDR